jgi:CHAT domain-containing protein
MRPSTFYFLILWLLAITTVVCAQTSLAAFEEALDQRRLQKAETLLDKIADPDARALAQCELFFAESRPDRTFALVERLDTKNLEPGLLAKYYYVRASQETSIDSGELEKARERILRLTREGLRANPSPHDRRQLILYRNGWLPKEQQAQAYEGAKELGEFSADWGLEAQARLAGRFGDDSQARVLWTSLMDSARLRKEERLEIDYGLSLVRTLQKLEQDEVADELLGKLLQVARQIEEPASLAQVTSRLVRRLVSTGELDEAESLVEQTMSELPRGELQVRLLHSYAGSLPKKVRAPLYRRSAEIATELNDSLMLAAITWELAEESEGDEYAALKNRVLEMLSGKDTRGGASAWFFLFIPSKRERPVVTTDAVSAFLAKLESAESPKKKRAICRHALLDLENEYPPNIALAKVVLEQYRMAVEPLGGLDLTRELSLLMPDEYSRDWHDTVWLAETKLFRLDSRVWNQVLAYSWQRDYAATNERALNGFVAALKSASSPKSRSDALLELANYLRFLGRLDEADELLVTAARNIDIPEEEARAAVLDGRPDDALPMMAGPIWTLRKSRNPNPWRFAARVAWTSLAAGDYPKAREWAERTIELLPNDERDDQLVYSGAPQVLVRALAAESQFEQADTRLLDFIGQVESTEFGSPDELLIERAELLRLAGQPARAQEVFQSVPEGYSDYVRLYRTDIGRKIARDLGDNSKLKEMDEKLQTILGKMKAEVSDPVLSHYLFSKPEFQNLPIPVAAPSLPPTSEASFSFGEVLKKLETLRRREPENTALARLSAADLKRLMTETGPTEIFVQPIILEHSVVMVCVVKDEVVVIESFCDTTQLKQAMVGLSTAAAEHAKAEGMASDRQRVARWLIQPWHDIFPNHDKVKWMGEGELQSFQLSLLSTGPSEKALSTTYLDGPGLGSSSVGVPSSALLIGGAEDLAGAQVELQQVRKLFPQGKSWTLGASLEELKSLAPQHSLVHIATHGVAPSGQRLGGEFRGTEGRLNAFSLSELRFPAKTLAVVSACEGGQSYGSGHDNTSLLSALRTAGADVVVGSVWAVDDTVGQELFLEFYRQLKLHPEPAQALVNAQKKVQATHPHPYYWAGVRVLTGP